MRLMLGAVLLLAATTAALALPKSVEEFRARQTCEARSPQGAAKLWFDAVMVYMGGEVQLGAQLMTIMMTDKQWALDTPCVTDALRARPYLLRSYVKGATPENGYSLNPDCYELNIRDLSLQPLPQFPVGKVARLMLQSGGADAPRALDLERDSAGLYAIRNAAPLCVGIRPPVVSH